MAEARTMHAKDVVSAKLASCYITIDGERFLLMQAKNLEARVEKNKVEVPILGNTVSAHCVVNVENASVVGGTFTLPMKIDVLDGALTVDANFVGTPMQVE